MWTWVIWLACGGSGPETGGAPSIADQETEAPRADSAAGLGDGASDSAGDTAPDEGAPATLTQSGVVSCPEPGARSAEPFFRVDGGPSWRDGQLPMEPQDGAPGGRAVVVADLDGDGQLDIFLANTGQDQLYMGRSDGTWVDETTERWFTELRNTAGAAAVDFDDDGDLDLFTANRGGRDYLYLNDGSGHFTATVSGLTEERRGSIAASFGDMDLDGDLDLFVGTHHAGVEDDGPTGWLNSPASLYENLGGALLDRSELLPQSAHDGFTFAATWLDLDADGDSDLYLVNDFGELAQGDVALLQEGAPGGELRLVDASSETGLGIEVLGMGLATGDLNGDARPELLVSDWDRLRLLESQPDGTWADVALSRGLEPAGDQHLAWGAALVDIDNDGDLDAPVSFGHLALEGPAGLENPDEQPDALYLQAADGSFSDEALSYGLDDRSHSRGFAVADLNRDGYPDLVKVALNAPASIWMSRCGDAGWFWIALEQSGLNRDAVGARIEVEAGGETWRRWISGGGDNLGSMGPLEAHFGLGALDRVDALTVFWPAGGWSRFEDIETRQRLRVTRLD